MAEIQDRESLTRWLEGQPKEVVAIIAARAAMRVLPLMITGMERVSNPPHGSMLLCCLRAVAAAWASGIWPAQSAKFTAAVAAAADAASDFSLATAAATAAYAAYAAVTGAVRDTIRTAVRATEVTNDAGAVVYAEIKYDAEYIDRGGRAQDLGLMPLWRDNIPREIQQRWEGFLDALPNSHHENWNVWIDWYQDRGLGDGSERELIEELEVARVLIPDEDWEKGPAHVNKLIQDLEDQYRRVDPSEIGGQELTGTLFRDDGPEIDTSAGGRQQRPTSSEVAEDFHASLREALESLIAATDIPGRTSNRFTDVTSLSRRLLEALGSGPASVRPAQTIAQAGKLDRAAQADDRRRDDPDLEGPALSADEREALDNAVDAAKTYINTDPVLGPIEQARLGKAQVPIDDALARNIVDAAADEGAATEDAREAVDDAAEAGPEGTKSRFYGATILNFMRAALRIGAKYSLTTKAGVKVARWLVKHKTKILTLLDPWPELRNTAERIIAVLEKLPLD